MSPMIPDIKNWQEEGCSRIFRRYTSTTILTLGESYTIESFDIKTGDKKERINRIINAAVKQVTDKFKV